MEKLEKSGLSLKNFTYTNKKIADDIYEAINSTSFLGVSVSHVTYSTRSVNLNNTCYITYMNFK